MEKVLDKTEESRQCCEIYVNLLQPGCRISSKFKVIWLIINKNEKRDKIESEKWALQKCSSCPED